MSNGTNYAKVVAPVPASYLGPEQGGDVHVDYDTFTFAGEAAGAVVNVGVLKPGEVFLGGWIIAAALGSGVTIQVGDAGDADRYLAATVMNTGGLVTNIARAGSSLGIGYKNETSSDIPIFITTGAAAATGRIDVVIFKGRI